MGNPESKMNEKINISDGNYSSNPIQKTANTNNKIKGDLFRRFSNYRQPYPTPKSSKVSKSIRKSTLINSIINNIHILTHSETLVSRIISDQLNNKTQLNSLLAYNFYVNKVNLEKIKLDAEMISDYEFQVEDNTITLNSYLNLKENGNIELCRDDNSETGEIFNHIFDDIEEKKISDKHDAKIQSSNIDDRSIKATTYASKNSKGSNKDHPNDKSDSQNKIEEQIYVKNKIPIKNVNINKKSRGKEEMKNYVLSDSTILSDRMKNQSITSDTIKNDSTEVGNNNKAKANLTQGSKFIKSKISHIGNPNNTIHTHKSNKKSNFVHRNDNINNKIPHFDTVTDRKSQANKSPVYSKKRKEQLNSKSPHTRLSKTPISKNRDRSSDVYCHTDMGPIRTKERNLYHTQNSKSPFHAKNPNYSTVRTPTKLNSLTKKTSDSSKLLKIDLRENNNQYTPDNIDDEFIFEKKADNNVYKKKIQFQPGTNNNKAISSNPSSKSINNSNVSTIRTFKDTSPNISKRSYVDILMQKQNLNKNRPRSKSNDPAIDKKDKIKININESPSNQNQSNTNVKTVKMKSPNDVDSNYLDKLIYNEKYYNTYTKTNKLNTNHHGIVDDLLEHAIVENKNKIVLKLDLSKEDNLHKSSINNDTVKSEKSTTISDKLKRLKNLKSDLEKKITNPTEEIVQEKKDKFDENNFNYIHYNTETSRPTNKGPLYANKVSKENDSDDNRFSIQKRQTPKFDGKDKSKNSLSFRNSEDARFSFNMFNLKKSVHEPNIRYNFEIDDKIDENEFQDVDIDCVNNESQIEG